MTNTIKLLDVVALTVNLPEFNLWRGQVGILVEILADGRAFEVEFSMPAAGCAYAQDALTSHLVYVQSKLWCCILSQYLVMLQLNKIRGDKPTAWLRLPLLVRLRLWETGLRGGWCDRAVGISRYAGSHAVSALGSGLRGGWSVSEARR